MELLVGGIWMAGTVAAVDGFGVVLSSRDSKHAVVRVEAIAAVRIAAAAPQRTPIATGARPMPGPNGFQHDRSRPGHLRVRRRPAVRRPPRARRSR